MSYYHRVKWLHYEINQTRGYYWPRTGVTNVKNQLQGFTMKYTHEPKKSKVRKH